MISTHQSPLVIRGLKQHFGKVAAVDGVDIEVKDREVYGFLGVNGAGKTTTIRLLMGITAPDAGTITLFGKTEKRTTIAQKQMIGYVSQEQTFYTWMHGAQLGRFVSAFYPTWDQQEFERLLKRLEVPIDRRVSALSGGMKAKLALALALAPRPKLLILDEPTAGLDPVARHEFMAIVKEQFKKEGRSIFFSSHLIHEVERLAHRVGVIHQGKMRYEGSLKKWAMEIRRVKLPKNKIWTIPIGFELLQTAVNEKAQFYILKGAADLWKKIKLPAASQIETLNLEEIMIASVTRDLGRA